MTFRVGALPADYLDGQSNIGRGSPSNLDVPDLVQLLDLMLEKRVPGNVETAAFTAAANDTWEDYDIVAALNAVLDSSSQIRTGEAVRLFGTLEFVNGEAAINNAKYGHGGTPDDDDTVRTFATAAAAASEYAQGVTLITDGEGKIKIEVDDTTNLEFVFHVESFQYVKYAALT